ncbi:MAG: bifunctional diaminohydroxyphosphoribosylaminopyrimidine deaminase/5-amino-6-(5-phosphoribosylamino)uracil reductase RibD [Lentisphaerae bacterium]|nr:bifunctional diaminohydroxyphosphoribosylaminopyrimidine deaminase/5-amino-6-(5-phosphoribosylamino)uracil reductase RibD [Lentisphaerota bacterium]
MNCDSEFMREALALARMGWGLTNPNPMVGAVIVKDGTIIGRGFHRKAGEAHAEINALSDARRHGYDTTGATLYVTLEPCSSYGRTPPCTEAIIGAGISRVVIGSMDPNPKHAGRAEEILQAHNIQVDCGVENADCWELNKHFFRWITSGRPFVMLKMAMTLDGKIACSNGQSRWVTGSEARRRVQKLRRLADAVMIGGGTLRADHPQLTVREPENWEKQPLRIIVSSTVSRDALDEYFPDGRAEVVELPDKEAWKTYLQELGKRGITMLLIEGGGKLAADALRAGAVDFVEFHVAPKLLGGEESIPVLGGFSPESMDEALVLRRVKSFNCGDDIVISGFLQEV